MSGRDVELDVATLLEAAGLGTLSGPEPTLFAGPYPASAPDSFIACRHSGAEKPEKYLANTGLALHRESVTVLVRGTREPDAYAESGTRARAAWSALYDLHPAEYVLVDPEDGAPTFLGWDEEQRPRWSFTVGLEYLSATAPGVVVPLSREATLLVGGLSVTGDVTVGRLLVLASLPSASIPAPEGHRGALVFDTDAGVLRVSDGTAWLSLGAPPGPPTAEEVSVTPVGELTSDNVQAALEELHADATGHVSATTAHGVTGALVGTTDVQQLSNKKHSGLLEVVDVASGAVALRLPSGSRLALSGDGTRYLHFDTATAYITSSSYFRAPLFYAGTGLGAAEAAFSVDTNGWRILRNGRMYRQSADTTATAGNATANAFKGRAKVAAGQASVTLTNNLCLGTSDARACVQQATPDATGAYVVRTATAAGSLTIHLNTPPAADLVVAWEILD